MALQKEIAAEISRSRIVGPSRCWWKSRAWPAEKPTRPTSTGGYVQPDLPVGQFAEVTITGCHDYDLWARPGPVGTRIRRASLGKPGR